MVLRSFIHRKDFMHIHALNYPYISFKSKNQNFINNYDDKEIFLRVLVYNLGKNVELPNENVNHCVFNYKIVNILVKNSEKSLPYIKEIFKKSDDEKQIAEALYTLDRMIEANVEGIEKLYPLISRFNDTKSPTIQVLLAGIYRKTLVPDAFGPLIKMLIKNSLKEPQTSFDATEEIGGAILEYLRTKNAVKQYS